LEIILMTWIMENLFVDFSTKSVTQSNVSFHKVNDNNHNKRANLKIRSFCVFLRWSCCTQQRTLYLLICIRTTFLHYSYDDKSICQYLYIFCTLFIFIIDIDKKLNRGCVRIC